MPTLPSLNKDGIAGNPIGQLQELTQKNKWAPPGYEFLDYPGMTESTRPPREFKCVCALGKQFEQQGTVELSVVSMVTTFIQIICCIHGNKVDSNNLLVSMVIRYSQIIFSFYGDNVTRNYGE